MDANNEDSCLPSPPLELVEVVMEESNRNAVDHVWVQTNPTAGLVFRCSCGTADGGQVIGERFKVMMPADLGPEPMEFAAGQCEGCGRFHWNRLGPLSSGRRARVGSGRKSAG